MWRGNGDAGFRGRADVALREDAKLAAGHLRPDARQQILIRFYLDGLRRSVGHQDIKRPLRDDRIERAHGAALPHHMTVASDGITSAQSRPEPAAVLPL